MSSVVGIGMDLVELDRVRVMLKRTPSVATRVFTDSERARAEASKDPTERYAVRWAAKEAVMKALGVGLWISAGAIEVTVDEDGAPSVVLHDRAAERGEALGVATWQLSLSHTTTTAAAVALALGR